MKCYCLCLINIKKKIFINVVTLHNIYLKIIPPNHKQFVHFGDFNGSLLQHSGRTYRPKSGKYLQYQILHLLKSTIC